MSNKTKHTQSSPTAGPHSDRNEKESTKRHVYVEPGVQIDLVKDLKEQYEASCKESTAQANKMLLWTKIGAGLVLIYAAITGAQWWELRQNFRVDERAWLKFEAAPQQPGDQTFSWQLTVGQPVTYPLRVVNVGKTAAKNVDMKFFIDIVDADKEPPLSRVDSSRGFPFGHITTGIVFPSQDFKQTVIRPGNGAAAQLATGDEVRAMEEGKAYLAVYGIISYDDIFQIHRWTKFCTFLGDGQFRAQDCATYNAVDHN